MLSEQTKVPEPVAAIESGRETTNRIAHDEGGLTRRATLTLLSSFLEQGARVFVGFFVTPVIVRGLGAELYGTWTMIQQSVGYLTLSDLRPMGTLKFTLAVTQHVEDFAEKRRQIGAAFLIWLITSPVLAVFCLGMVIATPFFIKTTPENLSSAKWAIAILGTSIVLDRLVSLPGNVLRGVNLDYKAMGLRALTILLGGLLTAGAIWVGWGLVGLALSSIMGLVIVGLVSYSVAKRYVPWFGMNRPQKAEVLRFLRISGWILILALTSLVLNSSDLLLVGTMLNPTAAAVFGTTGALIRLSTQPTSVLLGSGSPGLAGLCGQRDWGKVERIRYETQLIGIATFAVIGTTVVALNKDFMTLWIGPGFYAGHTTNILMVLVGFEMIMVQVDGNIVDCMMEFRKKAIVLFFGSTLTIALGAILIPLLGLSGMAVGALVGRMGLLFYYPWIISQKTGNSMFVYFRSLCRVIFTTGGMLFLAHFCSSALEPHTWWMLVVDVAVLGTTSLLVVWFFGFDRTDRVHLNERLKTGLTNIIKG